MMKHSASNFNEDLSIDYESLEKLINYQIDGGIDYLKQVVIEDSIGIAEDLETEMQGLVNKYECEWKQAIENEEVMKRFKHFVNSDDTDDNIKFVKMRAQKKPKAWV